MALFLDELCFSYSVFVRVFEGTYLNPTTCAERQVTGRDRLREMEMDHRRREEGVGLGEDGREGD